MLALTERRFNIESKPVLTLDLLDSFIQYTDVKDSTLKGYKVGIRSFINYLSDYNIKSPKRNDIRAYKQYLEDKNLTAGTKHQYFRVVKHLFSWLDSESLYPDVARNIKGYKVQHDNTKKEAFTEEDIKIILESIDRNTIQGKRDYAILLLALTGGLRVIEIHRADIQDIQIIKRQPVIYIQGKGREDKDHYIKLIPEVQEALTDYLKERPKATKNSPLFTSTSNRALNKRITPESLSRIIKTIFRKAGYDSNKLTAHSLRHTSNTLLFKAGADLYQVQKHARHKDPKTTEIYIHAVDRESDTSEKDIYNQIYNPKKQSIVKETNKLLEDLSESEQLRVLDYIRKELKA